jgi:hypothetical protein
VSADKKNLEYHPDTLVNQIVEDALTLVNELQTLTDDDICLASLPPLVRELIELLGLQPAISLMRACGGTRTFMKQNNYKGTAAYKALGEELYQVLISYFANETIEIPVPVSLIRSARRKRALRLYNEAGMTYNQVAREVGRSYAWVARLIQQTDRQSQDAVCAPLEPLDNSETVAGDNLDLFNGR